MLVAWMVHALVVGTLLSASALLLEPALRERGLQGRWAWAGATALSVSVPLVVWALTGPLAPGAAPGLPPVEPVALLPLDVVLGLEERAAPVLERLQGPALALWGASSALLLVLGAVSWLRLRGVRSGWREQRVDGTPVLVSDGVGPAVVGLLRASIVLPSWVLEEGREARALILAHELEHVRCRDPLLVLAATLPALLLPWHLPLWWQLRRLRLAVELDCDQRVLGGAPAGLRRRYGALLLEAGARGRGSWAMAAAFSERRSFLESRIREIARLRRVNPRRAVGLSALAAVLLVVACLVPGPDGDPTAPDEEAAAEAGHVPTDVSRQPIFTPFSVRPGLTNTTEVQEALTRAYPDRLREAGIGGSVVVWFLIDETGVTRDIRLNRSSGHPLLDEAGLAVARVMRWTPALNRDQPVAVWVSLPLTFQPQGPEGRAFAPAAETATSTARATLERAGDAVSELRERARAAPSSEPRPAPAPAVSQEAGPRYTPFTVRPELVDSDGVRLALEEEYPPLLREAGIGGSPVVWLYIDPSGAVRDARVNRTSGHSALDEAALRVARRMSFTPALNGDEPVEVWVSIPITFAPR